MMFAATDASSTAVVTMTKYFNMRSPWLVAERVEKLGVLREELPRLNF